MDAKTSVKGLNAFKPEDRPSRVNAIFQLYHIMVGTGMILIGLTLFVSWQWKRGKLDKMSQ